MDAGYRILWLSSCPAELPLEEVLGRRPWEFLEGDDATRLRSSLLLTLSDQAEQTVDFQGPRIGHWRAWLYFVPLTDVRLSMLMRKTPAAVLLLSAREREICSLLAAGRSANEIASKLDRSRKTVDAHRRKISGRLGIKPKSLAAWTGEFREWL